MLAAVGVCLIAGGTLALAQIDIPHGDGGSPQDSLFGPRKYLRTNGAPDKYAEQFSLPASFREPFVLHVVNGDSSGKNRVSSARIRLNDKEVVKPSDLSQKVAIVKKTITLKSDNRLDITVEGAPGGYLTLTILGTSNHAPISNPGGPYTGTVGQPVAFDGRKSSDPDGHTLTYKWEFGDGKSGTGATPKHIYENAGQFTVRLTVNDGRGGTHSATTLAKIIPPAPQNRIPTAKPGGPYSGVVGQVVKFDGLGSSDPDGDPLTYAWAFGDGGTGTGASPTHSYASAGEFTVSLTVNDGHGGTHSATTTAGISPAGPANRVPTSDAGGPYGGEVGVLVTLDGSRSFDPDGDPLTYSWNLGNGVTLAGRVVKHSYPLAGDYKATLTVADGRGATHTSVAAVAIDSARDRMPPVITLVAPREAFPGAEVPAVADVSDNDRVESVEFVIDAGPPFRLTIPPYKQTVRVPDVAGPDDSIVVIANARDPAGNIASARASIRIASSPDTTLPTVSLNAPVEVGAGSTLRVSAVATDNVGVASVVFTIGSQEFSIPAGEALVASSPVPPEAAGTSLPVKVRAIDFAGNAGFDEAAVLVVTERDTIVPVVSLQAPPEVNRASLLNMTATATDAGGVASVDFLVNDLVVGTSVSAPFSAQYPVASSVPVGTLLQLRAVARDFSGNEAFATATTAVVGTSMLTRSVVVGEVYDDTAGLPLIGASVAIDGTDSAGQPYTAQTITDARGRFALPAHVGPARVVMSKDGWTRSVRQVLLAANTATEIFDGRLTPLAPVVAGVSPVLGGRATHEGIELELSPGALPSAVDLRLTPIRQQGLVALLPTGWSPVAGVDIAPRELSFVGSQVLRAPNGLKLPTGTLVTVARFEEQTRAWRAIASGSVTAAGALPSASASGGGQYAWLVADAAPSSPPAPVAGEPLGSAAAVSLPPNASGVITPQPRIIFYRPGVFSDVSSRVAGAGNLQSGTRALAHVSESYRFFSDLEQHPEPFTQDLVLYQLADASGAIEARHRATPSLTFEALALELGVITIELSTTSSEPRITPLIPSDGGSVTTPTGEELRIPANAGADAQAFGIQRLTSSDLGLTLPQLLEFVGGAYVSFSGELTQSATLSMTRPSTVTDASRILLARIQSVGGEDRLVLVAAARLAGDRLESTATLEENPGAFEGVRVGGRYVFVRPTVPFGFVTGRVLGTDGAVFAGGLISTPTLPLVAVSRAQGYVEAAAVGTVPLTALDVVRADIAAGQTTIATAGATAAVDLTLVLQTPAVVSLTPSDSSTNVPLGTPSWLAFRGRWTQLRRRQEPLCAWLDRATLQLPARSRGLLTARR